jgi:two-component system sensor histidine kinase DctS
LLWLLRQNDIDEQRSTLIADVLWLEQSVRFHLEGNSEQLRQLVLDLTRAKDRDALFVLRARHILKNNSELLQLLWLDAAAAAVHGMPTQSLPRHGKDASGQDPVNRSIELAQLGKPTYSDAYWVDDGAQFEVYVPIFDEGEHRGTLLAVYSLDGLLSSRFPGGSPKNIRCAFSTAMAISLASKSKIDAAPTKHQLPGHFRPSRLRHGACRSPLTAAPDNLAQTLIAALIVILAAAVFWSLWAVRGLIQQAPRRRTGTALGVRFPQGDGGLADGRHARARHGRPGKLRQPGFPANGRLQCRRADRSGATHALLGTGRNGKNAATA